MNNARCLQNTIRKSLLRVKKETPFPCVRSWRDSSLRECRLADDKLIVMHNETDLRPSIASSSRICNVETEQKFQVAHF